ncbi:MAG: hypothetical protein CMP23_04530 [Rickettsiales bacterium]|nr:hypothetical protein [Rickettsiales bacterium]|tara:strand:- start:4987 stop:5469 length:483 start_codon:yes stop_codon:yes gene_type:complete
MKRYRQLKLLLLAFFCAYILAACCIKKFKEGNEIFPIFTWSLFSSIPARESQSYAVQIVEVDGRSFDPPLDFMMAKELLSGAGDINAHYLILRLGKAIDQDGQSEARELRRLFESNYLDGSHAQLKYQVIVNRFNPVEKWKTGRVETALLKEYEVPRRRE